MSHATPNSEPDDEMIPPPAAVRARLYRARVEARLLARLLRISEDRARDFPAESRTTEQEARHVS